MDWPMGGVRDDVPRTPQGQVSVRLTLLNGFELTLDGVVTRLPRSAQRVVAFLALNERPLLRAYVAGTLWPDGTEDLAAASLRTALWKTRPSSYEVVEATRTHLALAPQVTVDIRRMSVQASRLIGAVNGFEPTPYDSLVQRGDLLPGWYDEWVVMERERLRQLRLHALEALCDTLSDLHRYPEAVQAGLAAVAGEPLRESAHRTLIRAHVAAGNRCEALRQYATYRQLAMEAFGIGPSPEMEAMVRDRS
jgi:DNA-binding SARP family transcriptional activator